MAQIQVTVAKGNLETGFTPGHAAITILNDDGSMLLLGLGPVTPHMPVSVGQYDVYFVPAHEPIPSTFFGSYANAIGSDYPLGSVTFTFNISSSQAYAALIAAYQYSNSNPHYNLFNDTVCTNFANGILSAAGISAPNAEEPENFIFGLENAFPGNVNSVPSFVSQNELTWAASHCFPAATLIDLIDGKQNICNIKVGDLVRSFNHGDVTGLDGDVPGRVTRIFTGVTREWLRLRSMDVEGSAIDLTVTPGHRFLASDGSFKRIEDILAGDKVVISSDGRTVRVAGERIVYCKDTACLFEETTRSSYLTSGSNAVAPNIERGWRTYNFEVGHLHTYIAGGVRVHNDSLGDLISAEDQYQNLYGIAFNPDDPTAVQQMANDIANGTIQGGVLATSVGSNGDLTNLEVRIESDNDKIVQATSQANGNTTFTDSSGDQITLNQAGQEVSEVNPDGNGGAITQSFGYAPNGQQFVTTEVDTNSVGQTTSTITNIVDPATGDLQSSREVDYNGAGSAIDKVTTDASGNVTTYVDYNTDGSQTLYSYDGAGLVTSAIQYTSDGQTVVSLREYSYDSSGNLLSSTTANGAGVVVDATDYDGATGNITQDVQYNATTGAELSSEQFNYGALRITPSWRRFAGVDRRARLAHERDVPFEGAFSFVQSLISPRFSTS